MDFRGVPETIEKNTVEFRVVPETIHNQSWLENCFNKGRHASMIADNH
jgi:hypothetical protein